MTTDLNREFPPVFDGHEDFITQIERGSGPPPRVIRDFLEESAQGHVDLPRAIALYEGALAAGHDNRYGWNLDPNTFNHFRWLESRLRQARLKLDAQANGTIAGR